MRAWSAALVLLAGSGLAAGLPNLPAPGREQQSVDLAAYLCTRSAQELTCRQPAPGAAVLYQVPVSAYVLVFRDEALARASIAFDEPRFDDVLKAMRAELGAGEEGSELLKAGMGGAFPNRYQLWQQDGQVFLLEQYFGRVLTSAVTQMSKEEFERFMAVRESQRVRGARDL